MKTFSITDTGVLREMNQDYYFASDSPVGNLPNLFIVADGMGGHKAGDYASRYTTERIVASASRNESTEPITILKEAIEKAGGKTSGIVSARTSYLINNDINSDSGKNKKAKELGVKIITEEQFLEMLKG